MKCKINEKEVANRRIPKVGEPWKHPYADAIYLRIRDVEGFRALQDENPSPYFYSIRITNGEVVRTTRSKPSIVILQPKGGEIIFEAKTSGD